MTFQTPSKKFKLIMKMAIFCYGRGSLFVKTNQNVNGVEMKPQAGSLCFHAQDVGNPAFIAANAS